MRIGDKYLFKITDIEPYDGGVTLKNGIYYLYVSSDTVANFLEKFEEPEINDSSCSICELYIDGKECEQRDTCPIAALQRQYWELLRQNKALKNELEYIFQSIIEASKRQVSEYKSRTSYIADIN